MPFREKLKFLLPKSNSSSQSRANTSGTKGPPSPEPSLQPALTLSASPSASNLAPSPIPATTMPSEEQIQVTSQALISQILTDDVGQVHHHVTGEHLSALAGAHDFVMDRPTIIGSQQFEVHIHPVTPLQESERPHLPDGANPPTVTSLRLSQGLIEEAGDRTLRSPNVQDRDKVNKRRVKTLELLRQHSISGAEYNSSERNEPPRCHPGTRITFREELRTRSEDVTKGTRIIWMHGPAGVGKSAIMQSVVEEVSPHITCATLFFSRANHLDDPVKVFPTLAYRLAVTNPEYYDYIANCMENDPSCLETTLDDQFKLLFIAPFTENFVKPDIQPWVIFIDGLDECKNQVSDYEGSDYQSQIMNLIGNFTLSHGGLTPFIWIIASRPEENLGGAWLEIQEAFEGRASDLWELPIPADSDQAAQDVEIFLHKEFEKIRKKYRNHIPQNSHWPSDGDFVNLAKKSLGYFIFASTVTKYISLRNPVERLKKVLSLIDQTKQHSSTPDENPFHVLDLLYSTIMYDIPERQLPITKSLLGFYQLSDVVIAKRVILTQGPVIGLTEACNILGLQQYEAYDALRNLRSVLYFPSLENASQAGIRFFHASFTEFCLDPSRSTTYHVDPNQELTKIWRRYTEIVQQSLTVQRYSGIELSWPPEGNNTSMDEYRKQLLLGAQNGWIKILTNNSYSQPSKGHLQVDARGIIDAFQSLGLAFLGGDVFSVTHFMSWLDERAPDEVREALVSQTIPLHQLNIERLLKSLCATPHYRHAQKGPQGNYVVSVDLSSDIAECQDDVEIKQDAQLWVEAKASLWSRSGEFRELVKIFDAQRVRVTVVGVRPSESCAIIGPVGTDVFYLLPYSVV